VKNEDKNETMQDGTSSVSHQSLVWITRRLSEFWVCFFATRWAGL